MKRIYQVFVSSTFMDLQNERKEIMETILRTKCFPSGMELFPASNNEQFNFIKTVIDDCDFYLLIIAGRYGSVNKDGISYTELEYDYAVEKDKNIIALIHDQPGKIANEYSEQTPESRDKLQKFKDKVSIGRLVKMWSSADQLLINVMQAINDAKENLPDCGWVRFDTKTEDI
ncbi:MAG: hypothetical protein DMF69_13040, partial [Acidobacteria bacterium]